MLVLEHLTKIILRMSSMSTSGASEGLALRMERLHVHYGQREALCDVNLALPVGSTLAIIGPNGSGKTTLVRTILGLAHPSEGRLEVYPGQQELELGYVPQARRHDIRFPATVTDLITAAHRRGWPFRTSSAKAVQAVLDQVRGTHLANRSIHELSGGELQRAMLARALVRNPHLLVLDEPATGIDAEGSSDLYAILDAYHDTHPRATVVMVTHDLDAARHHASHVLVLQRGQIAFGAPHEVLTESVLRSVFGHEGHEHAHVQPTVMGGAVPDAGSSPTNGPVA